MSYNIGAIYYTLLQTQYGIWTINLFKGHLILEEPVRPEKDATIFHFPDAYETSPQSIPL